MMFSRRARYSERARPSTRVFLRGGRGGELQAVETLDRREPGLLDPALDGPSFPFDHLQLGQAQQVAGMVDPFGGALAGPRFVLTQGGREPQGLQVMCE